MPETENDPAPTTKIPHSWDCMDAHMLPCRCGADEHNARVIPPAADRGASDV